MREAPSLVVIEELLAAGATITAHDPEAMDFCRQHHLGDRITYAPNPMSAIDGADALILVTVFPLSAKQVPATNPTYPVPTTAMRMGLFSRWGGGIPSWGSIGYRLGAGFPPVSFLGRLAQLVRAARLHRVGRGFESLIAHQEAGHWYRSSAGRFRLWVQQPGLVPPPPDALWPGSPGGSLAPENAGPALLRGPDDLVSKSPRGPHRGQPACGAPAVGQPGCWQGPVCT